MIAAACISAHLPPSAFGVDDADVAVVGEEILELLEEQARRAKEAEAMERMRQATR